jgi:hypothetical protein
MIDWKILFKFQHLFNTTPVFNCETFFFIAKFWPNLFPVPVHKSFKLDLIRETRRWGCVLYTFGHSLLQSSISMSPTLVSVWIQK